MSVSFLLGKDWQCIDSFGCASYPRSHHLDRCPMMVPEGSILSWENLTLTLTLTLLSWEEIEALWRELV